MLDHVLRRVGDETGAGAGLLFISPLGEHMRYVVHLHFPASNNMVEYEALLCGLRIAIELGIKRLNVRGDSQLITDQVMKEASCHDEKMEAYCNAVCRLEDKFENGGVLRTKMAKSSPMPGTYSSYVASILKIPSYLYIACTCI